MDEEHIFCCSVESEDFIWVFWNVLECLTQNFKQDIMCVGSTLQIYTWYFACLLSSYVWMPPKLWSISAFDWLVLNTCLIYMCLWLHVFLFVGEASAPTSADPIAMMEFYMKKAAQEEKFKQPKQSKDEMPPPASLQGPDLLSKIKFSLVSLKAFLFEPSLTNYFYLQLWASPVCVFFWFCAHHEHLCSLSNCWSQRLLLKKGITWVITSHKMSLRNSWLLVMMQLHRKLPKRLQKEQKSRLIMWGIDFCLKWVGKKVPLSLSLSLSLYHTNTTCRGMQTFSHRDK